MRKRRPVDCKDIRVSPFSLMGDNWMLLTSGDFKSRSFNTMTIGWGGMGTMWAKPLVMVVVRPTRYTYEFMEKHDTFTVTAFPPELKQKLQYLGSRSGRNSDKIAESGLTPEASSAVAAPSFAEADLVLECRKSYFSDFDPAHFVADYIAGQYNKDYHRMYFGEVVAASATDRYL